ncbi:MAG: asparaginase [Deltaproteobacteria bacterium]|nr:asparaginase [Deltaproteobacteria bacterium]
MENIMTPLLAEVTRGPEVESRHRGYIAVTDAEGRVFASIGDRDVPVCMRSLAKPFQALPVLTTGAARAFGFGGEELALFSGSLSGQDFHVALVKKILARIGLAPDALQCGAHAPLHRPTAKAMAAAGEKPAPLHHTCAGKHAAMLALCVHHGWPVANYLDFDHPVQQLILKTVGEMVGLAPEDIPVALDGCSAPVFYVPLRNIALGFARLAAAAPDSPPGKIMAACLAHPRLIAGDERLETILMETLPGRLFAKTGAEGGFALALKNEGWGVAVKIEDGASRPLNPVIIHLLDRLGLLSPEAREALQTYRQPAILNHRKQEVGRVRPVFGLTVSA